MLIEGLCYSSWLVRRMINVMWFSECETNYFWSVLSGLVSSVLFSLWDKFKTISPPPLLLLFGFLFLTPVLTHKIENNVIVLKENHHLNDLTLRLNTHLLFSSHTADIQTYVHIFLTCITTSAKCWIYTVRYEHLWNHIHFRELKLTCF